MRTFSMVSILVSSLAFGCGDVELIAPAAGAGGGAQSSVVSSASSAGSGGNDACIDLACDAPPPAACTSATSLRTFASKGTCESGACSYGAADTPCPSGCSAARCNPTPISAYDQTCAATALGALKCWGPNENGELGNGTTTDSPVAVDVVGLSSSVAAVAAGEAHSCAILSSGAAKCWGQNDLGELGNGLGSTPSDFTTPTDVVGLSSGAVAISAGHQITCALTSAGGAKCWGANGAGQLGTGDTTNRAVPADVVGLSSGVLSISAGFIHACAVTSAGAVECWGRNDKGQLGYSTTSPNISATPAQVTGLASGIVAVSAGYAHTCALTALGAITCWGSNDQGQLGKGTIGDGGFLPVDVLGPTDGTAPRYTAVSAGFQHTCALLSTGALECWGGNSNGELGDGSTDSSAVPVPVTGLSSGVLAVSAGLGHTCARTLDGVKCWGVNSNGQLGNGSMTGADSSTPVSVQGL